MPGPAGGQPGTDVRQVLHAGAYGPGQCVVLGAGVFGGGTEGDNHCEDLIFDWML